MPAIPRGFKDVVINVNGTEMHFLVCRSCGATVLLVDTHRNWHKRYGG